MGGGAILRGDGRAGRADAVGAPGDIGLDPAPPEPVAQLMYGRLNSVSRKVRPPIGEAAKTVSEARERQQAAGGRGWILQAAKTSLVSTTAPDAFGSQTAHPIRSL